jgi:hypothetical protein
VLWSATATGELVWRLLWPRNTESASLLALQVQKLNGHIHANPDLFPKFLGMLFNMIMCVCRPLSGGQAGLVCQRCNVGMREAVVALTGETRWYYCSTLSTALQV